MRFILLIISTVILNGSIYAQSSTRESISFGLGYSNAIINGDLTAKKSIFNTGFYAYTDKMFTPSIGAELKFNYNNLSGTGNNKDIAIHNTTLNNTKFKGTAIGADISVIYNISNIFYQIHKYQERKFNFSALLGLGMHRYNSKLYNTTTNELLADFGNSPSKNGTTTSLYYTTALNVKYKITSNLNIELRQNFNINNDDHLDAVVMNENHTDFFFSTNIGVSYSINSKSKKNYVWYDDSDAIIENGTSSNKTDEADTDKDGVIDLYDIEQDTPKGAIVYGNGVAIDSDEDGIIDLFDKCPLEFAKTKTGCLKIIDTDNDGVIDSKDECPNTYAKTLNGCPLIQKSEIVIIKDKITSPKIKTEIKPKITKPLTKEDIEREKMIEQVNTNNVSHGNIELDHSVNISDVDTSPVFPGCENKATKFDTTNCIISSIAKYVDLNYNDTVSNKIKGKVRVLFIVKEDGTTKVISIIGNYQIGAKKELKRVIETLPNIKAGTLNGMTVPVKYSLLFSL